jgi:hypothetical protein
MPAAGELFGEEPLNNATLVLDVHPGDRIPLAGLRGLGDVTSGMTVALEGLIADSYRISTPCGQFGPSAEPVISIAFYQNCDPDSFPLVGIGVTGSDTSTIVKRNVENVPNGQVLVSGEWQLAGPEELAVSGAAEDIQFVTATMNSVRVDGHTLFFPAAPGSAITFEDGAAVIAPVRPLGFDQNVLNVFATNEQGTVGSQYVTRWFSGSEEVPNIDLGQELLPWVGVPFYHAGTRTISWPQVGEADWDATHIDMIWTAGSGETFSTGILRVIAPPGANQVVLPRLPEELARYLPDDVKSPNLWLVLIEDAAHDGWDEARQVGYIDPLYEFDDWLFDPAAGDSVRVSISATPGPK